MACGAGWVPACARIRAGWVGSSWGPAVGGTRMGWRPRRFLLWSLSRYGGLWLSVRVGVGPRLCRTPGAFCQGPALSVNSALFSAFCVEPATHPRAPIRVPPRARQLLSACHDRAPKPRAPSLQLRATPPIRVPPTHTLRPDKESLDRGAPGPHCRGPRCKERRARHKAPTAAGPDANKECRAPTQSAGPPHKERRAPTQSAGPDEKSAGRGPRGPDTKRRKIQPAAGDRRSNIKVVLPEKENPAPPETVVPVLKLYYQRRNVAGRRGRSFWY